MMVDVLNSFCFVILLGLVIVQLCWSASVNKKEKG